MARDRSDRVELASAVLMALATVATAWCAFQSSVWSGLQTFRLAGANTANREATTLHLAANQARSLDVSLFVAWVEAYAGGEPELADFLRQRFPPELRKAAEAWRAERPLQNPDAPLHPFRMEAYARPEEDRAAAKRGEASELFASAERANHTSDKYTLATVLFATVLFFGGTATKLSGRTQKFLLGTGTVFFVITLAYVLAALPVSFGYD